MEEAGLSVRLDAAGNLIGRYDGLRPDRPVLAIGSHLDTVPNAGKYDGVLGVLLGLAAVKGAARPPVALRHRRDRVQRGRRRALSDSVSGKPAPPPADSIANCLIVPTRPVSPWPMPFARSGSIRRGSMRRLIRPEDCSRYLEVHIEQGPVLETLAAPAGVVEAIAGQSRIWAELRGRAGTCRDHADGGTARCARGRGRARAGGRAARPIDRRPARRRSVRSQIEPGVSNVIPGSARLSIDVRHARDRSARWRPSARFLRGQERSPT